MKKRNANGKQMSLMIYDYDSRTFKTATFIQKKVKLLAAVQFQPDQLHIAANDSRWGKCNSRCIRRFIYSSSEGPEKQCIEAVDMQTHMQMNISTTTPTAHGSALWIDQNQKHFYSVYNFYHGTYCFSLCVCFKQSSRTTNLL